MLLLLPPQPPRLWRNGGLWSQLIPDVRNFLTSGRACVYALNKSAHAQVKHKDIVTFVANAANVGDRKYTVKDQIAMHYKGHNL